MHNSESKLNKDNPTSKPTNNRIYSSCFGLRSRNRKFTDEEIECLNMKNADNQTLMKINDVNDLILDSLSLKGSKNLKQNQKPDLESDKLKSQYVNGIIKLQDTNGIIYNSEGSYYMNFKLAKDENQQLSNIGEQLRNVPKFMKSVWGMKSPQIIIPIITGLTNFKNWKNQKLEEQFRNGIIKAANKTEMWFITNGINGGISEMMGDAFNEENSSRSTGSDKSDISNLSFLDSNGSSPKPLTLIGIVSASTLQNWSSFDGQSTLLTASGNKTNKNMYRFDVNPDHTHFIIYDDLSNNTNDLIGLSSMNNLNNIDNLCYDRFRDKIESLLTRSLNFYKNKEYNKMISDISDDDNELINPKIENRQVPMVCLVIRGDLKSIDAIDFKIRKEIPVIILKGTGAVSDIIAFAFEELSENKDVEYEENFIRPEVSKKLNDEFKDELTKNDVIRNQFRDKILSIVKNGSKAGQKFLTVVDTKGLGFDFADLDKYILTALLQSQTQLSGKQGKAQLERNLRLTLDWNCPALALSEIFQRDDYTNVEIKHNIFENAILRKDREEFVELFLDQGFYIHRYLGRNNIRDLFTKSENREFFVTIILQGVLGHFTNELPENFLPDGLNEVLKELTSIDNMVNILEMYMNQLGFYVADAKQAEKKALNFLIIFAVLFNRHKLAKVLWKRTEDPLAIALVCSLMYKNLLIYCQESYLKSQLQKYQKDFADSANGVLDASFQDNDPRSYSVLTIKHPDWNDCTVLELAYNAKNLDFIAHPACQKILTKRLFGAIQVRDIDNGFIDFPAWVKVILSAFLVFPMYYWIVFPIHEESTLVKHKKKRKDHKSNDANQNDNMEELDDEEQDEEEQEAEETKAELNKKLITEIEKNRKHSQLLMTKKDQDLNKAVNTAANAIEQKGFKKAHYKRQISKKCNYVTPPFYRKIYLIWSSPFTKFWVNFLSYICFLALFGIVTLWPCCGNLILDSILWLWTATITIEDTRIAYKNYLTGSQLPMTAPILEIGIMLLFLVLFFFIRILGAWEGLELFGIDRIFMSKALLCVFLLYFYYRTLFIFLPISHQLGPMLVRMKLMVKHDFMTYLRLFLISMTAGGIALNAILYPFHPINFELMKKVLLLRGFLQLFVADKLDLERPTEDCRLSRLSHKIQGPYSCVNLTNGIDFKYSQDKLESFGVSYKCNYMSLLAWFILIQYFLLVKLFLPTLLTAMFSATGARVSEKSAQLWMFQRYEIVLDYENRLIFPPPFTVILYLYMMLKSIFLKIKNLFCKCRVCCKHYCLKHKKTDDNELDKNKKAIDIASSKSNNNYWKNIAQRYSQNAEKEANEKSKQKQIETNLNKVREDLTTQKKSLKRLNDRVISIEKSIVQNQSYLEQIKNLITQKQSKSGLLDRKKRNYIHILSRESPYVNTSIPRFFVYEKLVPWDMNLELYDPPFIVLSIESYKIDRIFIDDEINSKVKDEIQVVNLNQSLNLPLAPVLPPSFNLAVSKETYSPSKVSSREQISNSFLQTPSSPLMARVELDSKSSQKDLDQQPRTRKSSQSSVTPKQNIFVWNAITFIDNPLQIGKKITIDRKSWISTIDEKNLQSYPLIYSLDSIGYPRNPMGRTGVRGRGALLRYGPNHEIMAIVTRWKKQKNKPIYVERRKLLEFIAVKDCLTGLTKIPGERILGDESKFSVVCRTFMELVFEETDVEKGTNFDEEDMMSFFASFGSQSPITYDKTNKQSQLNDILNDIGFVPTMIYKGYIDDPRNTDNAWVEAEIWNFHYDKEDYFDKRIKNATSKWREVSSNVRINSNEIISDVLKEISEIHNAFFN